MCEEGGREADSTYMYMYMYMYSTWGSSLFFEEKVSHLSWWCCFALPCLMRLNHIQVNIHVHAHVCS